MKQLNKVIKLYYFDTLKARWDGQGKIKMYHRISRVKKQLLGKGFIILITFTPEFSQSWPSLNKTNIWHLLKNWPLIIFAKM